MFRWVTMVRTCPYTLVMRALWYTTVRYCRMRSPSATETTFQKHGVDWKIDGSLVWYQFFVTLPHTSHVPDMFRVRTTYFFDVRECPLSGSPLVAGWILIEHKRQAENHEYFAPYRKSTNFQYKMGLKVVT